VPVAPQAFASYPHYVTARLASLIQNAIGPDYRIEQELSGGGMSRLFLATDIRHDRRVVVKVLSPDLITEQSTARFRREIELTVKLQHPHILPILTSGAWEDVLYYITPFIPGESLRERIARDGKLPLDDIVKILRDVSGALAFAHQRGIAHRDVKPGNILLAEGHAILADFGIARAIGTTQQGTPITTTGLVPGTPAYMAPELPTDEKADVYALGVVAYEMLVGKLPKRAVTAREIIAGRGRLSMDHRRRLVDLAAVVARALAGPVDRRTETTAELRAELEKIGGQTRRARLAFIVTSISVVVAAAVTGVVFLTRQRIPPADSYAVLSIGIDSLNVVSPLRDAMAEWRGVTVVETRTPNLDGEASPDAVNRATQSLAEHVVVLQATRGGDSVFVKATVYGGSTDHSPRSSRTAYASRGRKSDQTMVFRRLANSLLRAGNELPWNSATDDATASLAAWRIYDGGRAALARWDLSGAAAQFRAAIRVDARVAPAHVWLSQTILWIGRDAQFTEARISAERALESGELDARDSIHAAGLLALAAGHFPEACAAFQQLKLTDSTRVVPWIGLGDCRAWDRAVIVSRRSPSGSAFRGSFEEASHSYQRAAELGSTDSSSAFQGWILGRLSRVRYAVPNVARMGVSSGGDSITYAALPVLDHDTLAFWPLPLTELSTNRGQLPSGLMLDAIRRNRAMMRRVAEEWVRRAPQDPAAYDSLATWVEVSGGVATVGEAQLSTSDVVRRALQLASDSSERIHLGVSTVRLLVKDGKFAAARIMAESLLAAGAGIHTPYVPGVAGLAALIGHIDEAARLLALDPENTAVTGPRGIRTPLPRQVSQVAGRLVAYASLGANADTTELLLLRFTQLLPSYFTDSASASEIREAILARPLALAYPVGGELFRTIAPRNNPLLQLISLEQHNDVPGTQRLLRDLQRRDRVGEPGFIELTYVHAKAELFVGDTSEATRMLDLTLQALPTLQPMLLEQVPQVGALVRALALRAEIARAKGDGSTAVECAAAVRELFKDADPQLQPLVRRMRAIAP